MLKVTSLEIKQKLINLGWVTVDSRDTYEKMVGLLRKGEGDGGMHDFFFGPKIIWATVKRTHLQRPEGITRKEQQEVMSQLITWDALRKQGHGDIGVELLERIGIYVLERRKWDVDEYDNMLGECPRCRSSVLEHLVNVEGRHISMSCLLGCGFHLQVKEVRS